jgi:molybdate transport system ATP-binding protein
VVAACTVVVSLRFAAAVSRGGFRLEVEVQIAAGEVLAVLGPNGAGKSTLLRSIAGLLPVDTGEIALHDIVLDAPARNIFLPPERRGIGVVFQDHRLFPHLRVIDNVAFGPRSQGVPRAAALAAAQEWLQRLGLDGLADRHPRRLSGGQAQRVALARALAAQPVAFLLDEPLAALDVATRAEVQGELREHLEAYDGPTLLITHDPVEALLLADRIAVLENGVVVQQGTPAQITSRPVTDYVAKLVGVNLYRGAARSGTVALDGGGSMVAPDTMDGRVLVAIRPSAFTLHTERPHATSARIVWQGAVRLLAPLADRIRITVDAERPVLVDVTPAAVAELHIAPGDPVWLTAKATDLTTYPETAAQGGVAG